MLRNLVVAALFVLTFVQPANADHISFTFGISSDITVPANQRVDLPAVLDQHRHGPPRVRLCDWYRVVASTSARA